MLRAVLLLISAILSLQLLQADAAALDTVTRKSTDKRTAGDVTEVSRADVTVKPKIGELTTIPANDIKSIEWEGEPAATRLARSQAAAGQFELAIENYEQATREVPAHDNDLKADIAYGLASAIGMRALQDPERRDAAVAQLRSFAEQHPQHYRYYDALLLLGDVQLANGDHHGAETAFDQVRSAPWPDYQMAAKGGLGWTALSRGDVAAARTAFDEVASAIVSTPVEQSRKFQAMLGQAACLQQEGHFEEAVDVLDKVIHDSAADETRLLAEAYLRQGDCYAAMQDKTKYAVLAYLHLDVIPALTVEKDLHAQALYKLSELWSQLGHPDRADLAAGKLQAMYPDSPWTAKLTGP